MGSAASHGSHRDAGCPTVVHGAIGLEIVGNLAGSGRVGAELATE